MSVPSTKSNQPYHHFINLKLNTSKSVNNLDLNNNRLINLEIRKVKLSKKIEDLKGNYNLKISNKSTISKNGSFNRNFKSSFNLPGNSFQIQAIIPQIKTKSEKEKESKLLILTELYNEFIGNFKRQRKSVSTISMIDNLDFKREEIKSKKFIEIKELAKSTSRVIMSNLKKINFYKTFEHSKKIEKTEILPKIIKISGEIKNSEKLKNFEMKKSILLKSHRTDLNIKLQSNNENQSKICPKNIYKTLDNSLNYNDLIECIRNEQKPIEMPPDKTLIEENKNDETSIDNCILLNKIPPRERRIMDDKDYIKIDISLDKKSNQNFIDEDNMSEKGNSNKINKKRKTDFENKELSPWLNFEDCIDCAF